MVELLVVIVIFLVGILAVLQIFPRRLQIVSETEKRSVANQLVRTQIDQLRAHPDRIPEMILPVLYVGGGPSIVIAADPNRSPDDLGPYSPRIDPSGNILDGSGNALGSWAYLSGPNLMRRIIGEGGPVPAPRSVGTQNGGLMVLQFAPIVFNPTYQSMFQVYGNNLVRRNGSPSPRIREWEFFVEEADEPTATIYVLRDPAKVRSYRLAMTAYIESGPSRFRREIVDSTITVPAGAYGYVPLPLASFAGLSGPETLLGVDYGSVKLSRNFERVLAFSADPYEYQMLDETLGLILFNPAGYNYMIPLPGGRRVPLTARVNYDVYDWRILHEEFRISAAYPAEQRLMLKNLMHKTSLASDGTQHQGLNVLVSDEAGGTENRDFLLLDLDTGGIYSKASIDVDYSGGMVRFIDADANPANGVQVGLVLPGAAAPSLVTAEGRSVRALYQAVGEWAVQVTKPASVFRQVYGRPGAGQFYAGGSNQYYFGAPQWPGESPTRIYFPPMDLNKKVTIGQIYYDVAGGGEPLLMEGQDFLITNSPADTVVGLPYIDLRTYDPNALSINYARHGLGVRNVRGASVTVRVLFNRSVFTLTSDEATNLENFEKWGRNWVKAQEETYLQPEAKP